MRAADRSRSARLPAQKQAAPVDRHGVVGVPECGRVPRSVGAASQRRGASPWPTMPVNPLFRLPLLLRTPLGASPTGVGAGLRRQRPDPHASAVWWSTASKIHTQPSSTVRAMVASRCLTAGSARRGRSTPGAAAWTVVRPLAGEQPFAGAAAAAPSLPETWTPPAAARFAGGAYRKIWAWLRQNP